MKELSGPWRAFRIGSVPIGDVGQRKTVLTLQCHSCPNTFETTVTADMSPSHTLKEAHKAGWKANGRNPRATTCPDCQQAKRKPKEDATTMTTTQTAVAAPLTSDQRLKIRHLLDTHYDDSRGRYLDGYSDQVIGREVDVAFSKVAEVREAAYGPLAGDDDVSELRKEIDAVKADIVTQLGEQDRIMKMREALVERLSGIDKRLRAIEKRFTP